MTYARPSPGSHRYNRLHSWFQPPCRKEFLYPMQRQVSQHPAERLPALRPVVSPVRFPRSHSAELRQAQKSIQRLTKYQFFSFKRLLEELIEPIAFRAGVTPLLSFGDFT